METEASLQEASGLNLFGSKFCDSVDDNNKFSAFDTPSGSVDFEKEVIGNAEEGGAVAGAFGGHEESSSKSVLARIASCSDSDFDGYWNENGVGLGMELDTESAELASNIRAVALTLEGTLRAAKKEHLSCGEVLLPPDLLHVISRDIIRQAESEPCGLRGCLILLSFESGHPSSNHQNNNSTNNNNNSPATATTRKIGKIKCDKNTVNTFELNLLLREDLAPWYSRLPQILRNLTKGGTIVISPKYEISKKKLYRSHN